MSSAGRQASPMIDRIAKEISLGRMGNIPDRDTAATIEAMVKAAYGIPETARPK